MLRALMLTVATLAALGCTPLAAARPLVDIAVIDRDRGDWLPQYRHRDQHWIAGTPGHRYGVRLTNTSGARVLVVLSVDGVNAVTGETAHPSQAGYVLEPWQSAQIDGWRKSLDDVAQFVFTDLHDSYAARTGRPDHVGVIGVAVLEARRIRMPRSHPPIARGSTGDVHTDGEQRSAAAAPASSSAEAAGDRVMQGIGTGHGPREWSPTAHTAFVRASRSPKQVSELRYDDREALVALGMVPAYPSWRDTWPKRQHAPQAFPGRFVADPPSR